MIKKLVSLGIVAGVVAAVRGMLPDIKRYLEMRRM